MQVNRYLKDKSMDHIDHALGRPVDPMGETYRNYFATGANDRNADAFRASPYWHEYRISEKMAGFEVTAIGRKALRDHLKEINDPWRAYIVTYGAYESHQVGKSHANARYRKWLEVADCFGDMTFGEFCKQSRVRLA